MNFAKFSALTRIEQTFFALPFLITGAILAFSNFGFTDFKFLWMFPAFLAARISGMAFNQFFDRSYDAKNPRTHLRPLPTGQVTPKGALSVALIALFLFLLFASLLGKTIFLLALVASSLIAIYSLMKRIHFSCHFVLGAIHFLSPVAAWIIIAKEITLTPCFLGCAAFFSIAASDIVYAIADTDFDVKTKLHSIPARFGPLKALRIAFCLHLFCALSVICVGLCEHLGPLFYCAPLFLSFLFAFFYSRKQKSERLFYFCNVLVASSVMFFTLLDLVWRAL